MAPLRIAALAILSGIVLQSGLHLSAASRPAPQATPDPLGEELERCRTLHGQAATDLRCQAAYKQSRDQFFGSGQSPYRPTPLDPFADGPNPRSGKPVDAAAGPTSDEP